MIAHEMAAMDAACDYLSAYFTGAPSYAVTVAEARGTGLVCHGLAVLMAIMVSEAAMETGVSPAELVETIRDRYAVRESS